MIMHSATNRRSEKMNEIDLPKRTYMSQITFNNHGQYYLELIGNFYGRLRNQDYVSMLNAEKDNLDLPTRQERRNALYAEKLTKREADNIIISNDEQWGFVERTSTSNIASWMKEIEKIDEQIKNGLNKKRAAELIKEKEILESKIDKRKGKGHSVAFGGRRLQRLITRYPENNEYRQERNKRRLFLKFLGDKERTGQNPVVRVSPVSWEVSLRVPTMIRESYSELQETPWIVIGTLNPRSGKTFLRDILEQKMEPVTYQFVWCQKKQKWRVHFAITTPATEFGKRGNLARRSQRILGLDINAGHVDMSIVDSSANVLATQTIEYDDTTDMSIVADKIVKFGDHWGVSILGVENLSGLARGRKSSKLSGKGLNKAITKMRYALLMNQLESKVFSYGLSIVKVSPAYTSKNTTQWEESCFGTGRHVKASYLIARKAMGLSIERRRVSGIGYANSVWYSDVFDAPFDRQPHFRIISSKSTVNNTVSVVNSLV